MPTDTRTLLFIHGVRNDDPNAEWRGALDAALRREGTATLAQRGYEIVGPTYLRELEARSHPTTAEPELTYRKMSDQAYVRTAGEYWAALTDLQQFGLQDIEAERGPLGDIPAPDPAARQPTRFGRSAHTSIAGEGIFPSRSSGPGSTWSAPAIS